MDPYLLSTNVSSYVVLDPLSREWCHPQRTQSSSVNDQSRQPSMDVFTGQPNHKRIPPEDSPPSDSKLHGAGRLKVRNTEGQWKMAEFLDSPMFTISDLGN